MNHNIKRAMIAISLSGILFGNTAIAGIPVADIPVLGQLVVTANEAATHAKEQMDAYGNMINQAKGQFEETKDMISGNWKLGDFVDQQLMDQIIPDDWEKIYDDAGKLADLREQFGLTSDNPQVQEQYDKMLSGYNLLEEAEEANNTRVSNLKELGGLLNSAETPQQKEDLSMRIQLEQVNIQNEQIRLQNVENLMAKQRKLDAELTMKTFHEDMRSGLK